MIFFLLGRSKRLRAALGALARAGPAARFCAAIWAALAAGFWAVADAAPAGAACAGRDLAAEMAASDPARLARIRAAAAAQPYHEGRLWRISRKGAPDSWIFGTFHSAEPAVAAPPPEALRALRAARVLMLEVTPEETARMQAALRARPDLLMDLGGPGLDALLNEEERALARRVFAAYGMEWDMARRLRPWFAQTMLAQPPCALAEAQGAPVLDARLAEAAAGLGKPVAGLETWRESLGALMEQSPDEQRAGLLQALALANRAEDFQRTAAALYLRDQTLMIWEFGRALTRQILPEAEAERSERAFWRRVVSERNARFLRAAADELARGGALIAVGALHLPGKDGMLALLAEQGYALTRIPVASTASAPATRESAPLAPGEDPLLAPAGRAPVAPVAPGR
ncbi:TraB/GumN family protein [Oceanicella actignis]|uniref:TraB/GumN family protein n=1 Tax=Oceanicella actignis TaxID=1189325 RepID=UPI00125261FE|nr:TraB/GumN family protein [Oceanicella actignis]TYO84846.1 hypothetical protein LY05_02819 [Oceanicella actignis]